MFPNRYNETPKTGQENYEAQISKKECTPSKALNGRGGGGVTGVLFLGLDWPRCYSGFFNSALYLKYPFESQLNGVTMILFKFPKENQCKVEFSKLHLF